MSTALSWPTLSWPTPPSQARHEKKVRVRNEYTAPAAHSRLTREGMERARQAGKTFGRPFKTTAEQRQAIVDLLLGGATIASVARVFNLSRATVINIRNKETA